MEGLRAPGTAGPASPQSAVAERADAGSPSDERSGPRYPSVFFTDDLRPAPTLPPPTRLSTPRDLPRVELEHRRPAAAPPPFQPQHNMMPGSPVSSSDELRIEHADLGSEDLMPLGHHGEDGLADDERWDAYHGPPRTHTEWDDAGYDDADDDYSSSSGYSADHSPYSEDEDRMREEQSRPFPDPRLKNQQKYLRPAERDLDHPPVPQYQEHQAHSAPGAPHLLSHPSYAYPAQTAVTAYSYHPSLPASALSRLSPYVSPHDSPTLASATPHEVRVEAVPSNLPSPTTTDPQLHDPAALYAQAAEYYRNSYEDVRGRNPHPRLLWRSVIDRDALEVLDAHHERVRGGPLPRLALPDLEIAEPHADHPTKDPDSRQFCLGASGVDREREHAGVGEEQMKERVRRARRRGDPNRRTWSQAGRHWSRQMEQCGL